MDISKWEFQNPFAKKHIAIGRAEGKAEGKAEALLAIFAARGFAVTAAQHERVRTCADAAALDRWIERAVTAPSVTAPSVADALD